MKKLIFAIVAIVALWPRQAHAYTQETVEVYRSSATLGGVFCSSGTAIRLDTQVNVGLLGTGISRGSVRITNQDAAYKVWIGYDVNVTSLPATTTTANTAHLGESLNSGGGNGVFPVGRAIQLWCIAADGVGTTRAALSFNQFGFGGQ